MPKINHSVFLILLAYLSLLVLGFLDNLRAPYFADILVEMQVTDALGSWFFATSSLFAFLGSMAAAPLVQRFSSQIILQAGLVGLGLGFLIMRQVHDFAILLVACAFFGWCFGSLNVAQNIAILEAAPEVQRRRLFSGLHTMYGAASLAAPTVAAFLLHAQIDWRMAFFLATALPLLVWLWSVIQPQQEDKQNPFLNRQATKVPASKSAKALTVRGLRMSIALSSLTVALYMFGEITIATRLALWLRRDHGFLPDTASWWLAGFSGLLFIGRIMFTVFHFRKLQTTTILHLSVWSSVILFALGLAVHPLFVVLSGLSLSPFFPLAMDYIGKSFAPEDATRALSVAIGLGSLTVVLIHAGIGWLSQIVGLSQALWVGPCGLLLSSIMLASHQRWQAQQSANR